MNLKKVMTDIVIETNDFNTQVTKELFDSLNQEVREELMEFVSSIDFIKKIISPDIKRARDLPRDENGKIIIDVTEPHKLEDMDYFRPSALHFIKTGRYTDYKPSKVPNSPFRKWISEERRRCYEGYVRESDGEWITGDYYFFLNYCPMMSQMKDEKAGISVMKMGFPLVMDGQYYFSHYIWQARLHNNNAVCLASRGRGKSAFTGSMLAKRAELGETSEARKFCSSMVVASATKFLDGAETIIGRFTKYLDHVAKNTKWPRRRIRNTTNNLRWEIGYMNNDGTKGGVQNTVVGVTVGDDPGKIRGSRASLFVIEEFGSFGKLKELYENLMPSVKNGDEAYGQMVCVGCCCAGTKIFDKSGNLINIEDINDSIIGFNGNNASIEDVTYIQPEAYKECVEIITTNGSIKCSTDHPLLKLNKDFFTHSKGTCSFYRANELKIGDVLLMHGNDIFGKEHEDNAYLVGALFGDGNYSEKSNITLSITTEEEYDFYNSHYKIGISKLRNTSNGGMYAQIYFKKELYSLLKKYEMSGKAFENKCLPNNIWQWDKKSIADFLAGYFDADGNVQIVKDKHRSIKLSCKYKNILEQIQYLLQKFNIYSYILKENKPGGLLHSVVNNKYYEMKPTESYVLYICNGSDIIRFRENIHLKIKYKRERLESYILQKERGRYNKLDFEYREKNGKGKYFIKKSLYDLKGTKIIDIKNIGVQRIYNLTANTTHTYLSNGFISSNTAGDKDSDFEGAKELFYNPIGHDIEPLKNVWDKAASGRNTIAFFYPAYLNTKGRYDKDGNSNVIDALIFLLKERYKRKYNSDDPMTLVKYCAENPITPEESMMKTARSYFPVAELNERIKQLENDSSAFDEVEVGELFFKDDGTVDFKHTRELPIRFFPHNDNKIRGAVEIFTRPVKDETTGKPTPGRYIASLDPIDKDSADTMSLSSTFVFDLYTDTIVAEYTGRRDLAVENYEITRMLCYYYNAQCYFENNLLGFKSYMQSKGDLIKYVALTPNNLKTQGIAPRESISTGNYGIRTTSPIIDQMNMLIRDWITEEVPAEDVNGNEIKIKNLYLIKNIALLKELVLYNDKGNFDRVRSFGLLMIGRDECLMRSGGVIGEKQKNNDYKEDKFISQCLNGGRKRFKSNFSGFERYSREEVKRILNIDSNLKLYHFK